MRIVETATAIVPYPRKKLLLLKRIRRSLPFNEGVQTYVPGKESKRLIV
jgi:hypothetical protein